MEQDNNSAEIEAQKTVIPNFCPICGALLDKIKRSDGNWYWVCPEGDYEIPV